MTDSAELLRREMVCVTKHHETLLKLVESLIAQNKKLTAQNTKLRTRNTALKKRIADLERVSESLAAITETLKPKPKPTPSVGGGAASSGIVQPIGDELYWREGRKIYAYDMHSDGKGDFLGLLEEDGETIDITAMESDDDE